MAIEYLNIRLSKDGLAAYGLDFTDGELVSLVAATPKTVTVPVGFVGYALIGPPSQANFLLSDAPISLFPGLTRMQQNPGMRWVDQNKQPNIYIEADADGIFTISWYKHVDPPA